MPETLRAKENIVTVQPVKTFSKEQFAMLAQKVKQGQFVPAVLTTTDDGTRVVRPVLAELTH